MQAASTENHELAPSSSTPCSSNLTRTASDWKLPDDYPRISLFPEVMSGIQDCQKIMDSFWNEYYAKNSSISPIVSFYSMVSA